MIEAALDNMVHRVLALSTDKAVNPVNLYGARSWLRKSCSFRPTPIAAETPSGSVASVMETSWAAAAALSRLFREQRKSGRITITDPRYDPLLDHLEQGVRFVLSSIEIMAGGEVFVPKIPVCDDGPGAAIAPNAKSK